MNSNSSTTSTGISSDQVSADSISRRAYEIWEQEGKPEGNDLKHWLQAERELSGGVETSSADANGASPSATAKPAAKNTGTDTRPLQGTRAASAANREPKKGTTAPFERVPSGSGGASAGTKRR